MIQWRVEHLMLKRGWTTAYRLSVEAGLTKPAAARVLAGDRLKRIDADILEAICRTFRVKPSDVLEIVD